MPLQGERQYCKKISVFIKTSPFDLDDPYYGNQATGGLPIPSNDTRDIVRVAMDCLDRIFLPGMRYQKAGVMLGDFYSAGVAQLALFDEYRPRANSEALMCVLDGINHSGKGKMVCGAGHPTGMADETRIAFASVYDALCGFADREGKIECPDRSRDDCSAYAATESEA